MIVPESELARLRLDAEPNANFAIWETKGETCIVCLICGVASFNANDIGKRYCFFCHQFFEFLPPWKNTLHRLARLEPGEIARA